MCGIAGIMTTDGSAPDAGVLDAFESALGHRGPDGHGQHLAGDVGMVQTRLAIIDLETGDQPFVKNGTALVANGEIYNYVELRAKMTDVDFATASDCEPPLHLYLKHGVSFAEHLRGMYAIAIHDGTAGRLVLSRDPFGIKPLYYGETDAGFVFASEPRAIIQAGLVDAAVDASVRDELLQLQFTCGSRTIFPGIKRVLPGETLVIEGGRIVSKTRRNALPDGGPIAIDKASALRRLDEVLNDSVGVHQRSDVPYGMFFSGGVDSSVLLAMMTRLNERPVRALTAGFSDTTAHDERDHARAVAHAAGADHMEVDFSEQDFWTLLPSVAAAMDDPAADYAVLPTFKLAATARAEGLKVVLSGEGGDELFAGYARYRHARRPWPFARPMRRHGIFDTHDILRPSQNNWRDGIAAAQQAAATPGRTRLQVIQATDCADWLPADLLGKLDRCLMAHGVEGRVPLLDPVIADFALRLPDALKVRRGRGKWLLRRWLETALPEARPFTRKRGFTVPVADWIARDARRLGEKVAAQPGVVEACLPGTVESLFSSLDGAPHMRRGKAAWTILFYALWHNANVLGRPSDGNVFDSL